MRQIFPTSMVRYNKLLGLACLGSLTLGVLCFLVYFDAPFLNPDWHENMFRRGLFGIVPWVAGTSIVVPICTLWFFSQLDNQLQDDGKGEGG